MSLRGSLAIALTAAGIVASAPAAMPAPLPAGVEAVAAVEGIHEYRLSNGLRVLLFPDPTKETVVVNITYLVGSRHENYGETGMAHLLEHLMFKGSARHPDVPGELTAHGCRPNGTTWVDRTNYFETFAASDENLAWALDLEADRMVASFIAKKDLDSEMTVVRNEFEMGENNPKGVLEERIVSSAYLWHNYGKSTIGARSDIENVPIERLQAFYRTWYQPDNAVLVVAGEFDEAKTLALVQEKFGAIPRPARVLPAVYTAEPAQDGERTVTLRRVGDTKVVTAAYHVPAGSHADYVPLELLAFILGDTPSGRLHEALVETGKAASVSAWAYPFHDPGLLLASAELRVESSIEEVRDVLIAVAEGAAAAAPAAEEVERARERLLKDWELTMRNSERVALELSEWAAMGDWRLMFLERDRLRNVTPADVQRVAAAYLRPSNRTVGIYVPTREADRTPVPPAPDVAAMVEGYRGGEGLAAGEDFDASPANLEAHVRRSTLPSGLELVLLPKKTRGGTVNLSMALHFGGEQSLQNQAQVGDLAGGMLMRGTVKRSRQEIQDEIDRLRARLFVFGSATGARAGGEATRETVGPALRLVAEILEQPAFAAAEFDLVKQEMLLHLEESKSEPRQLASTAWNRHMKPWPPADVRYTATPEEEIAGVKKVTLDEVKRFHARFYGASAGELALVGDFDPAEVERLAAELFGGWKSAEPYARLATPYGDRPPLHQSLEAPDKEGAVFRAGLPVNLRDDDPEFPALVLGNFMTGGGFLNSRLATRLRQKEGVSYGVGSAFEASPWERDAWFTVFAISAPQNAERLEAAFKEEMAAIVERGFTAEEIAEAKSGWRQSRQVSRGQDRELAGLLATRAHEDRTLGWDGGLEQKVAALNGEEILAAIRQHIDPARMALVWAGDFARVKQAEEQAQQ